MNRYSIGRSLYTHNMLIDSTKISTFFNLIISTDILITIWVRMYWHWNITVIPWNLFTGWYAPYGLLIHYKDFIRTPCGLHQEWVNFQPFPISMDLSGFGRDVAPKIQVYTSFDCCDEYASHLSIMNQQYEPDTDSTCLGEVITLGWQWANLSWTMPELITVSV